MKLMCDSSAMLSIAYIIQYSVYLGFFQQCTYITIYEGYDIGHILVVRRFIIGLVPFEMLQINVYSDGDS